MSSDDWHDAGAADIPDGSAVARTVAGRLVMVVCQGGDLHATDAVCPHKFAMLTEGTFGDACVTCPQHEATFDLRTGHAGDDASWAGRLPAHTARVVDGRIHIRLQD